MRDVQKKPTAESRPMQKTASAERTANRKMENKLIKNIVAQFQDVQEHELWLDENFRKKIDTMPERLAFERPLPELHSVAELISHILVWRKESTLRLKGQDAKLTLESPENWTTNEMLRQKGWEKLRSEFYRSQKEIVELIENETDDYLERKSLDGYEFKYLIEGLIHHDLYHLGQIGIVTKFLNLREKTSDANNIS